jgi:hypothetical protein
MMGAFLGLAAAGTGLKAYGQYQAGRQQQAMADYNARLLDQRAAATEQAMRVETEMGHEQARRMKAQQRAAYSASGAEITSGTPLLVMAEQSAIMERDILQQRRNRMIEAQQLRSEAAMTQYGGQMQKRAGTMGAITTILGGAAQIGMSGMGGGGGGQKTASGSYGGGFTVPDYSNSAYMSSAAGRF